MIYIVHTGPNWPHVCWTHQSCCTALVQTDHTFGPYWKPLDQSYFSTNCFLWRINFRYSITFNSKDYMTFDQSNQLLCNSISKNTEHFPTYSSGRERDIPTHPLGEREKESGSRLFLFLLYLIHLPWIVFPADNLNSKQIEFGRYLISR